MPADLSDGALRKVYEKVYPSNELNPARLAALRAVAEYATRELRERLERAQGAERGPMKDSTGTWTEWIRFDSDCIVNGVEVKAGTSWGPFEKLRNTHRTDALAIREAKEAKNV